MLLNFCNPNQLLAAINIDGSVLTLFFRPDMGFECEAFADYIKDSFKIKSFPGTSFSEKNHEALIHKQSAHLIRLTHQHYDFGFAINKKLGFELIAKIKKYQATNSTSISIRQAYEAKQQQRSVSLVERFFMMTSYFKNFNINVKPNLPLLSTKNLKRLETELSKLPEQRFSSSPQIINFLNKNLDIHNLSHPSSLYMPARLTANTCPQLNGLVQTQNEAVNIMFNVWETILFVASAGCALSFYFRYLKPLDPAQNVPEQRQEQRRRLA
jgi:hypothetical protein